jgi:hypothetical protein
MDKFSLIKLLLKSLYDKFEFNFLTYCTLEFERGWRVE